MNFKVVQFEFPAFSIQVEKSDLHPKKLNCTLKSLEFLELHFENPESYPKKPEILAWFDWELVWEIQIWQLSSS